MPTADRAVDIHRENLKKKRRELEQASLDAASDFLDTDSNATFAMVRVCCWFFYFILIVPPTRNAAVECF